MRSPPNLCRISLHERADALRLVREPIDTRPQTVKVSRVPQRKLAYCSWLQPGLLAVALDFGDDAVRVHARIFVIWLTLVNWQMTNCSYRMFGGIFPA